MISQEQYARITRAFPVLHAADPQLVREFQQTAFFARIPAGKDVFVEGDRADAIALLISGAVRVYKIGETGREITLYRFGLGESCILTANAILSQLTSPAIATVEQEAQAAMIPADAFRDWVNRYDLWRGFVFDLLSQRLASVLAIVDEVAFRRVDTRVAALLLKRSRLQNPIRVTHQEIAAELGSSREVISRILEGFASEGMIRPARPGRSPGCGISPNSLHYVTKSPTKTGQSPTIRPRYPSTTDKEI
jgi:CRP/FNR family transcriptional regulator